GRWLAFHRQARVVGRPQGQSAPGTPTRPRPRPRQRQRSRRRLTTKPPTRQSFWGSRPAVVQRSSPDDGWRLAPGCTFPAADRELIEEYLLASGPQQAARG